MRGPVDQAIAMAERVPAEGRASLRVTLHSGRAVSLNVPIDMDSHEAIGLIGWVAIELPKEISKLRRSSLVVPKGRI